MAQGGSPERSERRRCGRVAVIRAPRISVITPVYNGASSVRRALDTVFSQSFQDFEMLVVDDGSTDDLAGALKHYCDPRLRILRQAVNAGAAAARNRGVREAKGDYIAFIDVDDEWMPDKLARQLDQLESAPAETGLSITGYILLRDRLGRRESRPLKAEPDWYMRLLAGCNVSIGSCALIRRSTFVAVGPFNETMRRMYDWDWLLRYAANAPIAVIEAPLAVIHSGLDWPTVETVDTATRQIWEGHRKSVAARSRSAVRLLRSTLFYERAAAMFHHRLPIRALEMATLAVMLYPSRGGTFYRHLLRRSGDLARGRFG